ncbi:unnamed protein product [Caretta caretta]
MRDIIFGADGSGPYFFFGVVVCTSLRMTPIGEQGCRVITHSAPETSFQIHSLALSSCCVIDRPRSVHLIAFILDSDLFGVSKA